MSLYPHLRPDKILLICGMISAVFLLCLYCTLVRPRHQHKSARDLGFRLQRLLVIFDFTVDSLLIANFVCVTGVPAVWLSMLFAVHGTQPNGYSTSSLFEKCF